VLFTDGITEARNCAGEEFGEERLQGLLMAGQALPASELRERIMAAVNDFSGGNVEDDMTLIVLTVSS
jgi:serine phosphatase RsbU (regulator of sigma subunit)